MTKVRDALCLVLAATMLAWVGGLWAARLHQLRAPTSGDEVCTSYRAFAGALLGRGAGAEAGIRMTAARLRSVASRHPGALKSTQAAVYLQRVMALPYATRDDLLIAARPVAVECGIDWRQGYRWQLFPNH